MTSSAIVPKKRGEAGAVIKQRRVALKGKNRTALGDIGNLINTFNHNGELQPEISRPITRSFGAQLLANANAQAANNKKSVKEVVDVSVQKAGAKVLKQRAITNPKPENVIEISSDSDQSPSKFVIRRSGSSSFFREEGNYEEEKAAASSSIAGEMERKKPRSKKGKVESATFAVLFLFLLVLGEQGVDFLSSPRSRGSERFPILRNASEPLVDPLSIPRSGKFEKMDGNMVLELTVTPRTGTGIETHPQHHLHSVFWRRLGISLW